jgi:predicted RNase H-like HicB family nuclease
LNGISALRATILRAVRNRAAQARLRKKGENMKNYRFSIVIEKDEDGYYAFCPELQGCYTQGDTYEEVMENIKDAIRLHLEDRIESGEAIQQRDAVILTSLEMAI